MFKFKTVKPLSQNYSEMSQKNPLRWVFLFRENETFTAQTGKVKCKDFFNELVYTKKTKIPKTIYGFNTSNFKYNEEGLYFLLINIQSYKSFKHNLKCITGKDSPSITARAGADGRCIILIPDYYTSSTYLISMISYLIRCCNTEVKYDDLGTLVDKTDDLAIGQTGRDLLNKWKLTVPEKYKKYLWYYCPTCNSENLSEPTVSLLHNNGARSWGQAVETQGDLV